ncbi:EamA family transporter [Aquitalea sp. FJL05]|uniref:DMT family transporter n=1 Tax=Aquitalea sp. FJL05 TaxID=2153366 RepID=UPI000F5AF4FF|nr:DMT family transporter [Aquitalea sp. FJL05]RQO68628.1 EamA family transporter [Aquitalea sp. FJL05]
MLPAFALSTAMLLWASAFIALKIVFAVFDPLAVLFARMIIASCCLLPMLWQRGERWRYQRGDWRWMLAMGLAEPCLYFLFEAQALVNTSASQASVITATLPLLSGVGAMLFLREKMTSRSWLGLAVSFAGVLWLTLDGQASAQAPHPALGNLLEFCAMLCATCYVLIAKRLSRRYSALAITGMQTVLGSIWFGAALLTPWAQWPAHFPLLPSLLVLYLGACVTLGAYGLYTWAVSKMPVAHASAFINLIPLFTVLLAWLLLDETLVGSQWLACLLVLGGVVLGQHKPSPSSA